jgi:hypothetical protein
MARVLNECHGSCPHEPLSYIFRFPVHEDTNRGLLGCRVSFLYFTFALNKLIKFSYIEEAKSLNWQSPGRARVLSILFKKSNQ